MIANRVAGEDTWRSAAACRMVDTRVFFPDSDLFSNRVKLICSTCPVRVHYLTWAMATAEALQRGWTASVENHEHHMRAVCRVGDRVSRRDHGFGEQATVRRAPGALSRLRDLSRSVQGDHPPRRTCPGRRPFHGSTRAPFASVRRLEFQISGG